MVVKRPFKQRADADGRWAYSREQGLWKWACAADRWKAVLSVVPETVLAHVDPEAAWEEFNEAASDYLALTFYHHARFAKGSPVQAWRKRRKHLEAALQGITKSTHPLYWLWGNKALYLVDEAIVACEMIGSTHKGRRSPERAWLYSRLLGIWTARFNGKLTPGRPGTAKAGKRVANSPAIRFLLAALTLILRGDMIGAEAAEKIVEAEIARRKRITPEMVASWVKRFAAMKRRAKRRRTVI